MIKKSYSQYIFLNILLIMITGNISVYPMMRLSTIKASPKVSKSLANKIFTPAQLNSLTKEATQELEKFNLEPKTEESGSKSSKSRFFKAIPAIAALGYATSSFSGQNNDDNNQLGNEWNENKTPLSKYSSKKAFITHTVPTQEAVDRISQNGMASSKFILNSLLSNPSLPEDLKQTLKKEQSKFEQLKKIGGFIDTDQIFFAPEESFIGKHGHIGIFVDPDKTYVFNMSYKDTAKPEIYHDKNLLPVLQTRIDISQRNKKYKQSKVLLATYLESLKKAEQMQHDDPNKLVLLDEQTAEPFYTDLSTDLSSMYPYIAEIPFNTDFIPPTALYQKKNIETFDQRRFKHFRRSINDLKHQELIS